jgi:uncharacterized protein
MDKGRSVLTIMPYPFQKVNLNNSVFRTALELNREYLYEIPEERLLYTFKINAGIETNCEPLGGWERPDCKLRGHFLGHFLSACARYFAIENDKELKEKSDRIIDSLSCCQDKLGGYLSAFPESELHLLEKNEDHDVWAPYYTIHKIMQGLLDCHLLCGNQKSLEMVKKMADHVIDRFSRLSFWKIDGILRCTRVNPKNEFGGMSAVLHNLFSVTEEDKYLKIAHLFDRPYFLENLKNGEDVLTNLHANTHIPIAIGAAIHYEITGDINYKISVENFYNFLTGRTYVTGNSSGPAAQPDGGTSDKSEHWGEYGRLTPTLSGGECESCCGHNTGKLLEHLLQWTGDASYGDHIERLVYNSILNATSRVSGMTQYHQPLGIGAGKRFGSKYEDFWCCTGTGVEAMSELSKNIYFHDEDGIYVNLYISSSVSWDEKGLILRQKTDFPVSEKSALILSLERPERFAVRLRIGYWMRRGINLTVNGESVPFEYDPAPAFATIDRLWNDNDRIDIEMPMDLHVHRMPDNVDVGALMYGPVVLAALTDHDPEIDLDEQDVGSVIVRNDASLLKFSVPNNNDLELIPLYEVENQPYCVYMNFGRGKKIDLVSQNVTVGEAAYV